MQYPAKVLPRGSRYFFPRRSCCCWTWKSVKFVWTVCYSEVLKSLQKVSEDSIVLMQSSSSNYRRNRAESFWCRKQQAPFFALIHMSCEAGLSAASAMDGLVIEDYLCWGWGNKNYSLSYFLWRAISALQGYLVSYAMTTCFPLSGCWYRLIFCLEVCKSLLLWEEGSHEDCCWSILACSPYLHHHHGQPPSCVWFPVSLCLIFKEKTVPSCPQRLYLSSGVLSKALHV